MRRLPEAIRQKSTELWKNQSWILPYDNNASSHTSMLTLEFLTQKQNHRSHASTTPPYSPDLPYADFFLFPKLKTPMKVKRFATIEEIKEKSKQELLAIPKVSFRNVLRIGKHAGISVLYLKGGGYLEEEKIVSYLVDT